jgi:hypothetical protein
MFIGVTVSYEATNDATHLRRISRRNNSVALFSRTWPLPSGRQPKKALPLDLSSPRSYTPKFLTDKILTSRTALEGERKLVTVLFADVANFTGISEKLDPEDVHGIMDGCFKTIWI